MARRSLAYRSGPPVVTSLPASPVDGQEILYRFVQTVTPTDAAVLVWRLIWDAAAAAWLPVGRQEPVYAYRQLVENTNFASINVWGGVAVNDPVATAPRAGDYDVEWGCGVALLGGAGNGTLGLQVAGVDPTVTTSLGGSDGLVIAFAQQGGSWDKSGPGNGKVTLAAGATVKQRIATSVTGLVYRGRAYIKLYPRRITG